jgi:hypothetical protein
MDQSAVDRYYSNQASGPYFAGPLVQQGHGLGGLFGSLFRTLAPILKPLVKRGATAVAREALRTGSNIAADVLEGNAGLHDALKSRSREAAGRLIRTGKRTAGRALRQGSKRRNLPRTRRRHDILD